MKEIITFLRELQANKACCNTLQPYVKEEE